MEGTRVVVAELVTDREGEVALIDIWRHTLRGGGGGGGGGSGGGEERGVEEEEGGGGGRRGGGEGNPAFLFLNQVRTYKVQWVCLT